MQKILKDVKVYRNSDTEYMTIEYADIIEVTSISDGRVTHVIRYPDGYEETLQHGIAKVDGDEMWTDGPDTMCFLHAKESYMHAIKIGYLGNWA